MKAFNRRDFLKASGVITLASSSATVLASNSEPSLRISASKLANLQSITTGVKKITSAERKARRDKLRLGMKKQGHAAVLIEAGSTLEYFTGVKWWISERITAAVIPADGNLMFITPAFEESRLRELLDMPADILTWEEDEDPFQLIASWFKSQKISELTLGLDESVRHFVAHQLATMSPKLSITSARIEVNDCRMIKSSAEIALMQKASDVTMQAYRTVHPLIEKGMGREDVISLMYSAQSKLGGDNPAGGAQIGKGSALPHGSKEPEYINSGSVILMDFSCSVGGYRSDISRTFVFGDATPDQVKLWNHVHKGQQIAFTAAQVGTPAGEVDIAVRKYYQKVGYGPDYRLPGLSHRTGHGIGLDIHEPINFVRNEKTPLAPGMCLSNEPGLYVPGSYGVRLEDCLYITSDGPKWFSHPPSSIEQPIG
ncbi:Xaa-Pro peptidase family protein [Paraglaciecola sp. L1A13]|uniref:M24 family metallopeptidase n=1 Tax=Paraglaciecola sp. L1A13 TaxID=2686359 RepID=UPI00131B423C|nr:Xaa-Pro peptidase family protein [Paraglaciecola sp. L1A13]